jgi:hypothetical protein
MADINIDCPNGSVEVVVNLASARDGNQALADARAQAATRAKADGRKLSGNYGTRRDGDLLTIVFPFAASHQAETPKGE